MRNFYRQLWFFVRWTYTGETPVHIAGRWLSVPERKHYWDTGALP